jgi:hypothetical protein
MSRNHFLAISVVVGLLGALTLLASPGSGGPILIGEIDGKYQAGPAGTGLTDIFLTQGVATSPQLPGFRFAVSDLELMSGPGGTVLIGNPAGGPPTLTLFNPNDPAQMAVFDFGKGPYYWGQGFNGQPSVGARVMLAESTFSDLDFGPYLRGAGVFELTTKGVTVDSANNTVTVAPGATATFSLTPVPEPATGVLMIGAGAAILTGVALRRLRRHSPG